MGRSGKVAAEEDEQPHVVKNNKKTVSQDEPQEEDEGPVKGRKGASPRQNRNLFIENCENM